MKTILSIAFLLLLTGCVVEPARPVVYERPAYGYVEPPPVVVAPGWGWHDRGWRR